MGKIERCYGISTGLGYLVGSGGQGLTEELDQTVEEAARHLSELFGVDITIRFNTNRKSGGAFVRDEELSDKIGITAALHNSKLLKMDRREKAALSEKEWDKYSSELDTILVSTCLCGDFLREPSPYVCIDREFRDMEKMEDAVRWLKEGTNEKADEYIKKLKRNV